MNQTEQELEFLQAKQVIMRQIEQEPEFLQAKHVIMRQIDNFDYVGEHIPLDSTKQLVGKELET